MPTSKELDGAVQVRLLPELPLLCIGACYVSVAVRDPSLTGQDTDVVALCKQLRIARRLT